MVCISDSDIFVLANIRGEKTLYDSPNLGLKLSPDMPINQILSKAEEMFSYNVDELDITLESGKNEPICLNDHKDKTFRMAGLIFDEEDTMNIIVTLKNATNKDFYEIRAQNSCMEVQSYVTSDLDKLRTNRDSFKAVQSCETATPYETRGENRDSFKAVQSYETATPYETRRDNRNSFKAVHSFEKVNYVGLVNQAMTCYLNSLLQALFMTPEFRNALYNWEFDGNNPSKSIPYHLQRLFLNLQTSTRSAIETTDLTESFGWTAQSVWVQHDIQELCRVMFDALEQKFKDTKQANLINDLYEGKMLDYVKCLECGTEKSREDTFLDIPLPVRPFHSAVAYNSVEEALRAFVQPERLDGNNQYFCEKCNKKCDADKGLKFMKFPYLLTLHLKRFDFDFSTLHRIKLNDKCKQTIDRVGQLNQFTTEPCDN